MKKLLLPITLLLAFSHQANAMNWRSAFAKGMTAAHWFFVFSGPLSDTYEKITNYKNWPDLDNAPADVTKFVHQLDDRDTSSRGYKKLLVKTVDSDSKYLSNSVKNTILIDTEEALRLQNILHITKNGYSLGCSDFEMEHAEKMLDESHAILNHELNHIKNKDAHGRMIAGLAVPILQSYGMHKLYQGYCTFRNFLSIPVQNKSFSIPRNLLKMPFGIGKNFLNLLSLEAYSRYVEQRADDGIKNDKRILEGNKRVLEKYQPSYEEFEAETPLLKKHLMLLLDSHPTPEQRIKKINARLEKLEQEKNK